MEPTIVSGKAADLNKAFNHIFQNALGNPIIFEAIPTLATMKANSFGKYGTTLYIKFADGTGISINGVALT